MSSQSDVLRQCLLPLRKALLLLFAMCSAIRFPRRQSSQALFGTLGVLCIALVLLLSYCEKHSAKSILSEGGQNTMAMGPSPRPYAIESTVKPPV
jgi:hypothetical protein